jgi:hypothetical protein
MGDRAELQFRAEFFNIFNRANFQGPIRTRSAFQSTGSVNSSFGEITQTATTSRNIQFALKIVF